MPEKLDSARERKIRDDFPSYPFPAHLRMKIDRLETGLARIWLPFHEHLTQGLGYIHGGAITSLCDTSVGIALFTLTDEGEKILTIELKINFIAPAGGDIFSTAKIIHKGRKTAVGEVDVTDGVGVLIAKGLITYYIYRD